METTKFMNKLIIFFATTFIFINCAFGSKWHYFSIINNTNYTLDIFTPTMSLSGSSYANYLRGKCTYTGVQQDSTTGNKINYSWEDSNNVDGDGGGSGSVGGGCTNRDKWVIFGIALTRGNETRFIPVILGMTHRKMDGNWYNGLFYVEWIDPSSSNSVFTDFRDGVFPSSNQIYTTCRGYENDKNACFGPYSQMEVDDKNDYNWPRVYQTENNWQFVIPANLDFDSLAVTQP